MTIFWLTWSGDFELDFYYEGSREWCDIYGEECSISFAKRETSFKLDLNMANGNYFHLLNFNYFNNSFVLNKPIEKCTKHQLDDLNDSYTPNALFDQLSFCVCCDKYEPNKLLNCPQNEWNNKKTTCKPLETTEKPITTLKSTTIPSLIPHDQTCQKIVGYYVGVFQRTDAPSIKCDAQFQLKIDANLKDQKIYFEIQYWNQSYLNDNDDELYIAFDDYHPSVNYNCYTPGKNCSVPFVNQPTYKIVDFTTKTVPWFGLLQFPSFNNSFTLNNTIGGCTNYQPYNTPIHVYIPNPSLFSYCVCCGEYNPHPSLNCPPNPWQGL